LEDTTVIEKVIMNQTELRKQKEFKNTKDIEEFSNIRGKGDIPYYELFYRYGEISKNELSQLTAYLDDKEEYETVDEDEYEQSLIVFARKRRGKKDVGLVNGDNNKGVVVFAEKLIPEKVKLSDELELEFYKPYREGHLGSFDGRWLRKGYREIGFEYQNTANEIGNQIKNIIKKSKVLFRSRDVKLLGKNILSSVEDGQIIICEDLEVLNNVIPNFTAFVERWNSNILEAQRALKAFEVATGENLASSTSATAAAIQTNAVGQFYNFKRQKLGLFFSLIFKSWVIPTLLEQTSNKEKIEIIGDEAYLEEYISAMAKGWLITERMRFEVMNGGSLDRQTAEQLIELKKAELRKNKKQFLPLEKDFFKDIEMYVDVNITGENINKQNRITNGLTLLQYLANPQIMSTPETRDLVVELATALGFRIKLNQTNQIPQVMQGMPEIQASTGGETLQGQTLNANQPQVMQ